MKQTSPTILERQQAAAHALVEVLERQLAAARRAEALLSDQAPEAATWEISDLGTLVGHLDLPDRSSSEAAISVWARHLGSQVTSDPLYDVLDGQTFLHADVVIDDVPVSVDTTIPTGPQRAAS